jgi:hypothetical protein
MEFFSTEPLETLIKKRSRFLATRQQHRDPGIWYDGLISVYDMRYARLRSPEDTGGFDGWWNYAISTDDSALGKPAYIAQKNAIFPSRDEVEAVDYYIKNFVWGKLQRTEQEAPYPYGIYGTPNWLVNRDPAFASQTDHRELKRLHVWRGYDYCHIFTMYFHMYEIATRYPALIDYHLKPEEYLERAQMTARAFFKYPGEIFPWYEVYKWGHMNEIVLLEIIAALEGNSRQADADALRAEWEKKVKYAVYDDKYPFRSEHALDRTAFETSYELAKYGATTDMKPDQDLWYDQNKKISYSHPIVRREDSRAFMDRQLAAGLSMRGWLEKSYYQYGADGRMTYMASMGGEGILDYALNFAPDPTEYLRLGYASYLSSWALMNTGDEQSNYGFWAPGKENDGAAGWEFVAEQYGRAFMRNWHFPRGAVPYDGEIDLGFSGALRMARTVVANDPLFGRIAYGSTIEKGDQGQLRLVPRDGRRQRFAWVDGSKIVQVGLDRDGFASEHAMEISGDGQEFTFRLENQTGNLHATRVSVSTTNDKYDVFLDKQKLGTVERAREFTITIPSQGANLDLNRSLTP